MIYCDILQTQLFYEITGRNGMKRKRNNEETPSDLKKSLDLLSSLDTPGFSQFPYRQLKTQRLHSRAWGWIALLILLVRVENNNRAEAQKLFLKIIFQKEFQNRHPRVRILGDSPFCYIIVQGFKKSSVLYIVGGSAESLEA